MKDRSLAVRYATLALLFLLLPFLLNSSGKRPLLDQDVFLSQNPALQAEQGSLAGSAGSLAAGDAAASGKAGSAPQTPAAGSGADPAAADGDDSSLLLPEDGAALAPEEVYTFLQGPRAWNSGTDWSGSWCDLVLAGQKFSVFGCGLCDLANIYSTLTPYECSPVDMFYYAQEVSRYHPVSGYGAIDWPELKATLQTTGIHSVIKKKPSYETFQSQLENSFSAIALVSSYNDSTYWQDVEGHYVNLWLYHPEDDTVLLADSGNPEHNRQRIPLRYVYDALKTGADYQYLLVTGVSDAENSWKHDGIDLAWVRPSYIPAYILEQQDTP